jgi:hypothetical protein
MKKLLLLLILASQPSFADLYKCTAAKTTYQDKPCQTSQSQTVIQQQPHKPSAQVTTGNNNKALIERDAHGKIKRSEKAKKDFKAAHPCPANQKRSGACPGYVIDHILPLACGGADSPENMQWQTVVAGKEKDSWERDNCGIQAKQAASSQQPSSQTNIPAIKDATQIVYTGRRGGRYVMGNAGKKRYLGRKEMAKK